MTSFKKLEFHNPRPYSSGHIRQNTAACMHKGKGTSPYCDVATQPALFRATYTLNRFFSEPLTLLTGRQHKFSVFV